MNFLHYLISLCKDLCARKQQDKELQEELQFHLEMQSNSFLKQGMTAEEARRHANLKLGGTTQIAEQVRTETPAFLFESLLRDVQYGFRSLKKSAGFSAVALISLSLSIGACTALFSLLHGILLRPLPYPSPNELVEIRDTNLSMGLAQSGVSARNVDDWRRFGKAFDGIAAYYTMGRTLTGNGESEVVLVTQVGADFFHILRARPWIGRTFTEEETAKALYNSTNGITSADPVVILSHALWMRRYGGDPKVIGRTITLERRLWKIVGVMPADFAMPESRTAMWIPWSVASDHRRDQHFAKCVARIKTGMTIQQAEAELNALAEKLATQYPENKGWGARITPLQEAMTGEVSRVLWVLLAAVGLVLIIACANIAILHLSRTSARIQESYVRLALGAGRARLIRQFLVESAILAITGAILGLVLAHFALEWFRTIEPGIPRLAEVTIRPIVFLWSACLTVVCTLLFGLAPALVGAGGSHTSLTGSEGLRTTVHHAGQRFRNVLVVIEIALAAVLLTSSGMLIRSFSKLQMVNPGFNPKNVLVAPVFLAMEKYGSGEKTRGYYKQLFERLRALPGVKSVGGATSLPASPLGPDFKRPVWDSNSLPVDSSKRFADVRMVTPDYFQIMGMSVLRGRPFTAQDTPDSQQVMMVNQTLARMVWGHENPVGKHLVVDYSTSGTYPYLVIGVVNDVRFHGLRSEPRPEIYFPHAQRSYLILNVAIRTASDPRLLIPAVRSTLLAVDPHQPAHSIRALEDLVDATIVRDRYSMALISCFAGVAFVLAMLGIYGVLAYSVRQRVREIGIRMALGAKRNQIIQWIAGQGLRLVFTGLVVGMVSALLFARVLNGLLFEVSTLDLPSYAVAILSLLITAILATWIPAWRAAHMDPTVALRYE